MDENEQSAVSIDNSGTEGGNNDVETSGNEAVQDDGGSSLDELSQMVDANGQKIEGVSLQVAEIDTALGEVRENVHALTIAQEQSNSEDVYNDLATIASYQTLLMIVIAAFVALGVGAKIASFLFAYVRDR